MDIRYETPGRVRLDVDNRSGPVEVRTHEAALTDVRLVGGDGSSDLAGRCRVDHDETGGVHTVSIHVPAATTVVRSLVRSGAELVVVVTVPSGADVRIATVSGSIDVGGPVGHCEARATSGQVGVGEVGGDLTVRTTSGDVTIGPVRGAAEVETTSGDVRTGSLAGGGRVHTVSGDVTVEAADRVLDVETTSGDVTVGSVDSGCRVRTVSGDQRLLTVLDGRVELEAVTGDLTVGIAGGVGIEVDAESVSGDLSSEIDLLDAGPSEAGAGSRVRLAARTVSGDVSIRRA